MPAVKLTEFIPAYNAPLTLIFPEELMLVIFTLLDVAALSVIPVTAKVPVLSVKLTLPLVVFDPLKLVTRLVAVFSKVPAEEFVVSKPPVIIPAAV